MIALLKRLFGIRNERSPYIEADVPKKYRWLLSTAGLPTTLRLALQEYGVQEVVGRGSNNTIIGWRDELNHAGAKVVGFSDDDIPWCGLFAAIVCFRFRGNAADVVDSPLWARNWQRYGMRAQTPGLGDVLVFSRGNGGHVGFYVGEDSDCYHVLGGNQSNKVCITRIKKTRLLAARRPPYRRTPATVVPRKLSPGGAVSSDES